MVCTSPITGWRSPTGQVVFSKRYGWSDKPVSVGCNQCLQCRLQRSVVWAIRMMHEARMHDENCFLTLTYDDEHLPEDGSLVKAHHQKFMRDLRYRYPGIRYYHVGEYGDQNFRPHYHTIVFGFNPSDRKYWGRASKDVKSYTSEELSRLWFYGKCFVTDVTFDAMAYVARYCMKKLTGRRAEEYGGREPEYATMSRRPGIGRRFVDEWGRDVFGPDACIDRGRRRSVPRFYDQVRDVSADLEERLTMGEWMLDKTGFPVWMPTLAQSPLERTKGKRVRAAAKHKDNQTPERLAVIDEITRRRVERLKREL